ncbi:hypothetical protein BG015_002260 [Linnemannia schmuckeri]|uniref:Protein kinase domain-containing protein n=1 Tax=Linnemannia schmuckeri TaxID=64567 RepID=A0A9P5S3H1_9FUNG|nr:hypothetical protein BG015_002260 [Linnemannia schmuckeri]
MTDDRPTVLCLVDGDPISKVFALTIPLTETIGQLRSTIHLSKPIWFRDLEAEDLTLWHVSIPTTDDDDDEIPILLNTRPEKKKLKATTRLLKVFDTELPDDTIHIIVQRPRPVTPSVHLWTDFKDSVCSMALDSISQYPHPQFKEEREFGPEVSLQELFSNDIGSVKRLPPFAKTTRIMGLPRGIPDLVCMKKGDDFDDPESILFPLEIKRPIFLRSKNLVRDYEQQKQQERSGMAAGPVQRALKQAFGYMRLNGYRYGVLSTYEQTWFLMRVEQNSTGLWVSPTVAFDSTEPTLLQCYLWFIRKAHNDHEWIMDPPNDQELETILEDENPPDDKRERKDSQLRMKTRSSSKGTTRVVLPAFDNMELISHDERAQTYKASWQGRNVVVKKCDLWNERPIAQELKHEARIYQVLRTLQGRYIPTLRIAAVADGMEVVLVTDFVGCDISRVRLDNADQGKIRAALSAIHDLGVVHGDLRPQNILVQRDGSTSSFYFVDFGLSRITTDKSELFQETTVLNSLLGNLATVRP